MLQRSFLGCRLRCALAIPRTRLCWHTFPCLPGPQSVRGCSASALCSILARGTCLRLILFCICPPLCAGALWPMPAWVWRDVRSVLFGFVFVFCLAGMCDHACKHTRSAAPSCCSGVHGTGGQPGLAEPHATYELRNSCQPTSSPLVAPRQEHCIARQYSPLTSAGCPPKRPRLCPQSQQCCAAASWDSWRLPPHPTLAV